MVKRLGRVKTSHTRLYGRSVIVFLRFDTKHLEWTAEDVELWLKKNGFKEEAPLFLGELEILVLTQLLTFKGSYTTYSVLVD